MSPSRVPSRYEDDEIDEVDEDVPGYSRGTAVMQANTTRMGKKLRFYR